MIVLGIDTGMTRIGWAVTESHDNDDPILVAYGLWSPVSDKKLVNEEIIEKLRELHSIVCDTLDDYNVTHILVERVPTVKMAHRDKVLAVENLMRVIAIEKNLRYAEVHAVTAKKAFTGNSKASKDDMKSEGLRRYGTLDSNLKFDTYDAVGISTIAHGLEESKWWRGVSE